MRPILAGIETEYGFSIPARGPETQLDDSALFVASCPVPCFSGWDYRAESPRSDLRGFSVESLQYDPQDAEFEKGAFRYGDAESRADRVLRNGARFYNDHGHPEYATPECWSVSGLVKADLAGERLMRLTGEAFEQSRSMRAELYKNNVDYSGASYGTHESYHVPRSHGFEKIFDAVTPVLIARTVLCGAGTIVDDRGPRFLLSARSPFLVQAANIETLYNRPIFNTRDEPHSDPRVDIRLHVICGDANRNPSSTAMKVALVKMALWLLDAGEVPEVPLDDPVGMFRAVARHESAGQDLARQILSTYLDRFHALGARETCPDPSALEALSLAERLLESFQSGPEALALHVDWAAKLSIFERAGFDWESGSLTALQSVDLAYHALDPKESLFDGLVEEGEVAPLPSDDELDDLILNHRSGTRADLRGWMVENLGSDLVTVNWSSATIRHGGDQRTIRLPVGAQPTPEHLAALTCDRIVETYG